MDKTVEDVEVIGKTVKEVRFKFHPVEWSGGFYTIFEEWGIYIAWAGNRCMGPSDSLSEAIALCESGN